MKLVQCISLLSILVLGFIYALGQEQEKPVVITPLVGNTFDVTKRDYFQLFPDTSGFQRAVFYLNPDFWREWMPENAGKAVPGRKVRVAGNQKISYLKNVLQDESIFLPPIYADWVQMRKR